jgi:hypothetical protein
MDIDAMTNGEVRVFLADLTERARPEHGRLMAAVDRLEALILAMTR